MKKLASALVLSITAAFAASTTFAAAPAHDPKAPAHHQVAKKPVPHKNVKKHLPVKKHAPVKKGHQAQKHAPVQQHAPAHK